MKQKTLKLTYRKTALLAALGILATTSAQATPVDSTIYAFDASGPRGAGTNIDYWKFSLAADAPNFSIDVRANEGTLTAFGGVPSGYADLNGDGEITLADTQFRVFQAATTPFTASSEYGTNDDNGFQYASSVNLGYADGSLVTRDSFLRGYFAAGTYIIAIGDFQITTAEAISGFNTGDALTSAGTPPTGQNHFDYRLTLATDFQDPVGTGIAPTLIPAPVPVPAALWLFGSALVGLVNFKRREITA